MVDWITDTLQHLHNVLQSQQWTLVELVQHVLDHRSTHHQSLIQASYHLNLGQTLLVFS